MITSHILDLVDSAGTVGASVEIRSLPGRARWRSIPTIEREADDLSGSAGASLRLLEEVDYRYAIRMKGDEAIERVEPVELFSADDDSNLTGRLGAGRTTGTVRIVVDTASGRRLTGAIEVRSRKLDYETEYRNMLRNLAEQGVELIQSVFAPGQFVGFEPDQITDAQTLYQRFAFVASLLDSAAFAEAIDVIRYRPDSTHLSEEELVDPGRAIKPDRNLIKQLTSAGPRQPLATPLNGMNSIPHQLLRTTPCRVL